MLLFGIVLGFALATTFIDVTLWVRGVAGKARGLVLGAAPASVSEIRASAHSVDLSQSDHSAEVRPSPPNKPIEIGRALANLAGFLWRWKWAILVVCFFSLAVGLMRGCAGPFDFGKSSDTLRAERDAERINSAVAKNERDVAAFAIELAERTHARTNAANRAVIEGQQELADVVANLPPMVGEEHFADLQRRYADAYERVLHAAGFEGEPNPAPPRSAPMRRPASDPV